MLCHPVIPSMVLQLGIFFSPFLCIPNAAANKMQEVLAMCWKITLLGGSRSLSMISLANTTRNCWRRTLGAWTTCLLLRSSCTGSCCQALFELLIPRKQIGSTHLYTQHAIWLLRVFPCLSSLLEWCVAQSSWLPQTGLTGIDQKAQIISLWHHMTLVLAFIIRYKH